MNPVTVLLWLLCAFVIAVFFGVISLFIYMMKERKKALKDFYDNRAVASKALDDARRFQHKVRGLTEIPPTQEQNEKVMNAFSANSGNSEKNEKMHQDGAHKGSLLGG